MQHCELISGNGLYEWSSSYYSTWFSHSQEPKRIVNVRTNGAASILPAVYVKIIHTKTIVSDGLWSELMYSFSFCKYSLKVLPSLCDPCGFRKRWIWLCRQMFSFTSCASALKIDKTSWDSILGIVYRPKFKKHWVIYIQ